MLKAPRQLQPPNSALQLYGAVCQQLLTTLESFHTLLVPIMNQQVSSSDENHNRGQLMLC